MTVGNPPGPAVFINPMTNIQVAGQNRPPDPMYQGKMNEVALWFAVAPVANGAYVYGTQPMYTYRANWIPERYTSTDTGNNGGWTIDYIKNFIRVSTGASILGEVDKWGFGDDDPQHPKTARFPSYCAVMKMDTNKPVLLIILPLIIASCGSLLMVLNVKMHRSMSIPIMRNAALDEIIKSSQTDAILGPAAIDKLDAKKPSDLGKLVLRFKEGDDGLWGLYSAKERS
ncbi:hypothetical protein N0V86_001435 [Didymella sp. IMI 355093]|nr:hypothetical protein N0V86_001435 [Didymella sp. IMI 355093]